MADLALPAPDAPAEEWGRLAMSIPGWPAAKHQQPDGQIMDSCGIDWIYSDQEDWDRGGAGFPVPNPDYSGTVGSLLALLGGAVILYGPQGMDDPDTEWEAAIRLPSGRVVRGRGLCIGRACIAAAAALGRWPGGAP